MITMNIATRLTEQARKQPHSKAVTVPKKSLFKAGYTYESLTFRELEERSRQYALGLKNMGFTKGDRTLIFIRPSLDFSALTFALFKLGLIPVFIDPGMGKENLLRAIEQVKPIGLIAVPEVHILRLFYAGAFSSIQYFITSGNLRWGGMKSLNQLKASVPGSKDRKIEEVNPEDTAAILFTSGGTGIPKGVVYTHKIFSEQTDILKKIYRLSEQDVDVPGFPLFSLFTIAMGIQSCIPDMNPSKPSKANPRKLVANIRDNKATFAAGSPAIWERVADYCLEHHITLPTLKSLVMFGAPISVALHRKFKNVLVNGTTYTPYGATESLPVANVSGKYIMENTSDLTDQGKGTCLGRPVPSIQVKIIRISDEAIEDFKDVTEMPTGRMGEIIVSGSVVTGEYYQMPDKTRDAKIYDHENHTFWHRMGDIGYLDDQGRLWFGGRLTHRVETADGILSSVQCEAIFNRHPEVKRTALIGLKRNGETIPAIVVERKDQAVPEGPQKQKMIKELRRLGKEYEHTQNINDFYFHPSFPVDVRHNIKIDRLKLRDEANSGRL
ncbi:MAG: hypothetical protein C4522_17400 [Desulfobacteraceae bacterium]|nr:MAG: hypothetical protein C4522_17400 [Desulfobacteraceae bacterium]